jgi:C4-dicarboxylate transporter
MLNPQAKEQTRGYIVGAFGLVAGLAWNDAVKALIDLVLPFSKSGIIIKFLYAIIVTILVIVIGNYVLKPSAPEDSK